MNSATAHNAVIGAQWGDEGKGKIVDFLAEDHDIIVRAQGGNNAGHTVVIDGHKYAFHLLPSAMLYVNKTCVLGNGMVIDPHILYTELSGLEFKVGDKHARIIVSDRAHLITPGHITQDSSEHGKKIGTTGRGIGPSYTSKVSRSGLRMHDFAASPLYPDTIKDKILPLISDTSHYLNRSLSQGKRILFEGAQATMLDIDHGTYPYVTSSNCTIGGIFTGSGIFPRDLTVIGVAKAYSTRVGNGPFITELSDNIGTYLRETGSEYGTTTGRPRRCGYLDLVVLRYAARINGLNCLALTKLDVLSGLSDIKICTAYSHHPTRLQITDFPSDLNILSDLRPTYLTLPGWQRDISGCRTFADLPPNAHRYIHTIEDHCQLPVNFLGIGPERHQIICH